MSLTRLLGRTTSAASRAAGRRRWLRWLPSIALAIALVLAAHSFERRVDTERRSWGDTVAVWVAAVDLAPGDRPLASRRNAPLALVPPTAVGGADELSSRRVRHRVGVGEIITDDDLVDRAGPLALVPDEWRAVPVRERVPSGASVGERVDIAHDGLVVARNAVVVERIDDVTLLAVPADRAAAVALAGTDGITLLRSPSEL